MHESAIYIKISSLTIILIFAAGMISGGIIDFKLTSPGRAYVKMRKAII